MFMHTALSQLIITMTRENLREIERKHKEKRDMNRLGSPGQESDTAVRSERDIQTIIGRLQNNLERVMVLEDTIANVLDRIDGTLVDRSAKQAEQVNPPSPPGYVYALNTIASDTDALLNQIDNYIAQITQRI